MGNFMVLGLPRSGSQIITGWIKSQTKDTEFYLNLEKFQEAETDGNYLIRREGISLSEDDNWRNVGDAKIFSMLRNPWNMMASHVQWNKGGALYKRKGRACRLWNEYYEEYLKTDSDIYFIIYDKWVTDINYRKKISSDLGLEFSDEQFERVPGSGGGSSFDGTKYDGKAQQMNVLKRYEQVDNYSMNEFKKSELGQELKNKWNHICDLEEIKELKIK